MSFERSNIIRGLYQLVRSIWKETNLHALVSDLKKHMNFDLDFFRAASSLKPMRISPKKNIIYYIFLII